MKILKLLLSAINLGKDTPFYVGIKLIKARPMTRAEYNLFRGWELPKDERGEDEGYLVEYLDGGKPNHPAYQGYISWSPKEQFDKAYTPGKLKNIAKSLRDVLKSYVRAFFKNRI